MRDASGRTSASRPLGWSYSTSSSLMMFGCGDSLRSAWISRRLFTCVVQPEQFAVSLHPLSVCVHSLHPTPSHFDGERRRCVGVLTLLPGPCTAVSRCCSHPRLLVRVSVSARRSSGKHNGHIKPAGTRHITQLRRAVHGVHIPSCKRTDRSLARPPPPLTTAFRRTPRDSASGVGVGGPDLDCRSGSSCT